MKDWVTQLKSVVYGEAVADALGVPYEFRKRGTFECETMIGHGTHNRPAGTWSDDTSMMLATLDSLTDCGGHVDEDDMREKFNDWLTHGAYTPDGVVFDVGRTCMNALGYGHGLDGEYDNGNGSLMRIAPLAFFDVDDNDIHVASAITHAHHISCEACVTYVHALRLLSQGASPREAVTQVGYGNIWERSETDVPSSGFVTHTLEAAFWCLTTTNSYKNCVLKAVNLGDDTDTTAAVAGALAGLTYGFDAIPPEWVETMRGHELLDGLIAEAGSGDGGCTSLCAE